MLAVVRKPNILDKHPQHVGYWLLVPDSLIISWRRPGPNSRSMAVWKITENNLKWINLFIVITGEKS